MTDVLVTLACRVLTASAFLTVAATLPASVDLTTR